MLQSRREMLTTAGAAVALASVAPKAFAKWEASERYPDPSVQVLDPAFNKYRLLLASVEQLYTGARWSEGPVWMGDWATCGAGVAVTATGSVALTSPPDSFGASTDSTSRASRCRFAS